MSWLFTIPWVLAAPSVVTIQSDSKGHRLLVDGAEFQVKGVGLDYPQGHNFAALVKLGGNSFRTWSPNHLDEELKAAQQHGLKVAVGLGLKKQLQGFDYNDEQAVKQQFERITRLVDKYKNHPSVLAWVVANEPNLLFDDAGNLAQVNPKVYAAINDIIDYIHQQDPNHPVTYTFAGVIEQHIATAMTYTPKVDILSVQVYGDLAQLTASLASLRQNLKIDKPVWVTEFGPLGHWEVPTTSWGRPIEEPGSVKAQGMLDRMQRSLAPSSDIIGHFAFLWGHKQERTPTWYGMINPTGELNARADALGYYWQGHYPAQQAPLVGNITLNGQAAASSVTVTAGQKIAINVDYQEPNQDNVRVEWQLLGEVTQPSDGGLYEPAAKHYPLDVVNPTITQNQISGSFAAPPNAGEYRLFVYVYDNQGKVGNANFPFLVTPQR